MALTVNHTTHSITVNLGSSPIFDIALERVLTELYQGRLEGFNKYKDFSQYPSKLDINPKVKDLIYKGS
jgi:ribosomal protein S12 methylthiotransferase accessory factor YcaO